MAHQKGAFQVSMGFIIAVVFAVIMLTLAITWIQGMFSGLSPLTHQVTDIARQNLLNELAAGGKVSIAAPAVSEWRRGETGSYALGIRNDDTAATKAFYVNVYAENAPIGALGYDDWLTYSSAIDLGPADQGTVDLIIRPAADARPGIYLFKAVVCESSRGIACVATGQKAGGQQTTAPADLYGVVSFALEIIS